MIVFAVKERYEDSMGKVFTSKELAQEWIDTHGKAMETWLEMDLEYGIVEITVYNFVNPVEDLSGI
jgi:hypothetical protein